MKPEPKTDDLGPVTIRARLDNIRHQLDLIESSLGDDALRTADSGGTQEPPK